jgi:hypothetical protein
VLRVKKWDQVVLVPCIGHRIDKSDMHVAGRIDARGLWYLLIEVHSNVSQSNGLRILVSWRLG